MDFAPSLTHESFQETSSDHYDIQLLIDELGGVTPKISPLPPKTIALKKILTEEEAQHHTISAKRWLKRERKHKMSIEVSTQQITPVRPVEPALLLSPSPENPGYPELSRKRQRQLRTEETACQTGVVPTPQTPKRARISHPSSPAALKDMEFSIHQKNLLHPR